MPNLSDLKGQPAQTPVEKSSAERQQILAEAVTEALAVSGSWRVEPQSDYRAIVIGKKRTNHVLHLILSVVTMGFWLPVWLVLLILNQEQKQLLTVDAFGNVSSQLEDVDDRPMAEAEERRGFHPTTRLGRWAVRLAGVWVVLGAVVWAFYELVPGGEWVNALVVYSVAFPAAVASGVLALIAIIRDKERALSVYAALIPLLFLLVLVVLEPFVGGEH